MRVGREDRIAREEVIEEHERKVIGVIVLRVHDGALA